MINKLKVGGANADIPSDYDMAKKINEIIDHLPQEKEVCHCFNPIPKKDGVCMNCGYEIKLPTKELLDVIILILPLAKGYAYTHDVGSNMKFIEEADRVVEKYAPKQPTKEVPDISKFLKNLIGMLENAKALGMFKDKNGDDEVATWNLTAFALRDILLKEAQEISALYRKENV